MLKQSRVSSSRKQPVVVASIGKTSNASVIKATQKNWDEWIRLLNKAGAANWSHQEIVAWLKTKHQLGPWWQQIVTTGYEIHQGKRQPGQNSKGEYQLTTDKTFPLSAPALWKFLVSEAGLQLWLEPLSPMKIKAGAQFEVSGEIHGEVRTLKVARRIRLRWIDPDFPKPTVVQVILVRRPKNKCILVFQHDHLPNARVKETLRAYWRTRLERLLTASRHQLRDD
jgi:uncharacterized protein YndB with AHSA1/START domain